MKSLPRYWSTSGTICTIIVLALVVCAGAYGSIQPRPVASIPAQVPVAVLHGPVAPPDDDATDVAILHGPVAPPDDDATDVAVLHGPVAPPDDDATDVAILHGPVAPPDDDATDVA